MDKINNDLEKIYWKCEKCKTCKARVHTNIEEPLIIFKFGEHKHSADLDS